MPSQGHLGRDSEGDLETDVDDRAGDLAGDRPAHVDVVLDLGKRVYVGDHLHRHAANRPGRRSVRTLHESRKAEAGVHHVFAGIGDERERQVDAPLRRHRTP